MLLFLKKAAIVLLTSIGLIGVPTIPPNSMPIESRQEEIPTIIESPAETILDAIKTETATTTACSCVRTAISLGLNIPLVNAKDLKPNSEPVIGGGILFYYPRTDTYHISVIEEFTNKGFLVKEGNFKPCMISERVVDYNDPLIIGFIK